MTVEADGTEDAVAEVRAGSLVDSTFIELDELMPCHRRATGRTVVNDQPVGVAELTSWLDESGRMLELTRSWRRRYLAATGADRPAIANEIGLRNLTDFNACIARLRSGIAGYERQLDRRVSDASAVRSMMVGHGTATTSRLT